MRAFMELAVKPGVALPPIPTGEPPSWMAQRPGGIRAIMKAFEENSKDLARVGGN